MSPNDSFNPDGTPFIDSDSVPDNAERFLASGFIPNAEVYNRAVDNDAASHHKHAAERLTPTTLSIQPNTQPLIYNQPSVQQRNVNDVVLSDPLQVQVDTAAVVSGTDKEFLPYEDIVSSSDTHKSVAGQIQKLTAALQAKATPLQQSEPLVLRGHTESEVVNSAAASNQEAPIVKVEVQAVDATIETVIPTEVQTEVEPTAATPFPEFLSNPHLVTATQRQRIPTYAEQQLRSLLAATGTYTEAQLAEMTAIMLGQAYKLKGPTAFPINKLSSPKIQQQSAEAGATKNSHPAGTQQQAHANAKGAAGNAAGTTAGSASGANAGGNASAGASTSTSTAGTATINTATPATATVATRRSHWLERLADTLIPRDPNQQYEGIFSPRTVPQNIARMQEINTIKNNYAVAMAAANKLYEDRNRQRLNHHIEIGKINSRIENARNEVMQNLANRRAAVAAQIEAAENAYTAKSDALKDQLNTFWWWQRKQRKLVKAEQKVALQRFQLSMRLANDESKAITRDSTKGAINKAVNQHKKALRADLLAKKAAFEVSDENYTISYDNAKKVAKLDKKVLLAPYYAEDKRRRRVTNGNVARAAMIAVGRTLELENKLTVTPFKPLISRVRNKVRDLVTRPASVLHPSVTGAEPSFS